MSVDFILIICVCKCDGFLVFYDGNEVVVLIMDLVCGFDDVVVWVILLQVEVEIIFFDGMIIDVFDEVVIQVVLGNVKDDLVFDIIVSWIVVKKFYKEVFGDIYDDLGDVDFERVQDLYCNYFLCMIVKFVVDGYFDECLG